MENNVNSKDQFYQDELHANGFVAWKCVVNGKHKVGVYDLNNGFKLVGRYNSFENAHKKLC